ncbi:MAG: hypothetical protein ACRD98_01920 [Nitrososphaera sp.]
MKRKYPTPKDLSFVTHSSTPPAGAILIASFQQVQDAKITAEHLRDGLIQIRGDLDRFRWKELKVIAEAIKTGLTRTDTAPTEILTLYTRVDVSAHECLVGIELWANPTVSSELNIVEAQKVAAPVLQGLTSGSESLERDFSSEVEGKVNISALKTVARETLQIAGGMKFLSPVRVVSGDQEFKISGRLSAKPDRSDFHPRLETLTGKFVGFNTHAKELLLLTEEKLYALNYAPDQVDLFEVTNAVKAGQDCVVRTYRTTDRKGNYDHAYAPDAPFKLS